MPEPPPSARREAAIVAALTLVGAVLRFWGPGRVGLNHFDEGIYAFAGLWVQSPKGLAGINPEVVAYAPPLYPMLVGVAYLLLGVSDVSAILVSQVNGVLLIPAVAWVGRRTFGPGAGAAAAALAALSGPHVAFSRMALTDSTFLLVWVLAIGFGGRFLERPGLLRAIPFGLLVGLAQNAKYNGALAGGIVALTASWGLVVPTGAGRRASIRAIGFGLIAAAIAALVYWPWYAFVEARPGGYAGLIAHHRGYLAGPSAWAEHWRVQMGEAAALAGSLGPGLGWGAIAWALAGLGAWLAIGGTADSRSRWAGMRSRLILLLGVVAMGLAPNSPWWVALAWSPWLVLDSRPGVRVLGAAWLVMAILTPFYHPYARLWLPLHASGWLVLAGVIAEGIAPPGPVPAARAPRWEAARSLAPAAGLLASLLHTGVVEPRAVPVGSPIEPTDGLRIACTRAIAALGPPGGTPPPRLLLVARPAVAFYLMGRLELPIARLPDLETAWRRGAPGDLVLLDTAVIPESSPGTIEIPRDRLDLRTGLRVKNPFPMNTPATTALDILPRAAFSTHVDTGEHLQFWSVRKP